jgi:hypothetical protein
VKVSELVRACVDSINHPERSGREKPLVTLEGKRQLFPHGGGPKPKRLLCVNSGGNKVWHYDAWSVLAGLAAAGLIVAKTPTEFTVFDRETGIEKTHTTQGPEA